MLKKCVLVATCAASILVMAPTAFAAPPAPGERADAAKIDRDSNLQHPRFWRWLVRKLLPPILPPGGLPGGGGGCYR